MYSDQTTSCKQRNFIINGALLIAMSGQYKQPVWVICKTPWLDGMSGTWEKPHQNKCKWLKGMWRGRGWWEGKSIMCRVRTVTQTGCTLQRANRDVCMKQHIWQKSIVFKLGTFQNLNMCPMFCKLWKYRFSVFYIKSSITLHDAFLPAWMRQLYICHLDARVFRGKYCTLNFNRKVAKVEHKCATQLNRELTLLACPEGRIGC